MGPLLSQRQSEELLGELQGLKRFCLSLAGSEADADDLLQATVERLLDRGIPGDAHTARWAYRVCKNLWIDELRSRDVRTRHAGTLYHLDRMADPVPSAEAQWEGEFTVTHVSEAMARLPSDQRLALILVTLEGRSYAEAAEILEVPVGTIMSRIARARKQLLRAVQ